MDIHDKLYENELMLSNVIVRHSPNDKQPETLDRQMSNGRVTTGNSLVRLIRCNRRFVFLWFFCFTNLLVYGRHQSCIDVYKRQGILSMIIEETQI